MAIKKEKQKLYITLEVNKSDINTITRNIENGNSPVAVTLWYKHGSRILRSAIKQKILSISNGKKDIYSNNNLRKKYSSKEAVDIYDRIMADINTYFFDKQEVYKDEYFIFKNQIFTLQAVDNLEPGLKIYVNEIGRYVDIIPVLTFMNNENYKNEVEANCESLFNLYSMASYRLSKVINRMQDDIK